MRGARLPGLLAMLGVLLAAAAVAQDGLPADDPPADVERVVEEAGQAEATEIRSEQAKVGERVRAILGAVEDFRGIRAEVEAGIVVLSGTAPSRAAAAQAAGSVEKLGGVLLVVDRIAIERELGLRLSDSWREVVQRLRGVVAALPLFVAALAIVFVFWLLARVVRDVRFPYRFTKDRTLLQLLLRQTVFTAVVISGIVAALNFLDAGTVIGTILGAAGVLGIALGFAFRNIVENYLAGVLLAIRQPFRARDLISIDGHVGTVLRMTSSETTLMDADGNHLRLPNARVFNGQVLNYSRNPLRRFRVAVRIPNAAALKPAQELGVRTLQRMNGVIGDPGPSCRIVELGEARVLIELYGWVDQRQASYDKAASEAQRLVKEAFDASGIHAPPLPPPPPAAAPAPPAPATPRPAPAPVPVPAPAPVPVPEPEREPPEAAPGDAPEEIDVSLRSDIEEQVSEELARGDEPNLLEGP